MISHFQWKPLFKKKGFPAGKYRFIIKGFIMKEFIINRGNRVGQHLSPHDDEPSLKSEIHELMLFHIYE